MPFREISVMDEKRDFIAFESAPYANVRASCRRFVRSDQPRNLAKSVAIE
jgi:hypothetical protein